MSKLAVIITNYNMPERTDALVEALEKRCDNTLFDVYVVDNGSDLVEPSPHTNVFIDKNIQTLGGWLEGYNAAKKEGDYFGYIFTITSTEIEPEGSDIIKRIIDVFNKDELVVMASPALSEDSTTTWTHMKKQGRKKLRDVPMVDNIFCAYRAEWFDKNVFDERFVYAWGTDLEQSYLARRQHRKIVLIQDIIVKKVTNIGYSMNRMNMHQNDRARHASLNMDKGMKEKYGIGWRQLMIHEWKDY